MVSRTTQYTKQHIKTAKSSRTSIWLTLGLLSLLTLSLSLSLYGVSSADESKSHTADSMMTTSASTDAGHEHGSTDGHATDAGHATEGEHAEGEHGESHELPNIISIIFGHKANPTITDIQYWENVIFAFLAGLFLVVVAQRAHSKRKMIPGRLQNVVEMMVEFFYDFFYGMLGKETKRMMPLLGSLFFYILTMNLMGLIPFLKSPTTSINITISLAIIIFLYSQYVGLKGLGFMGWVDHLAGSPRDVTGWVLVPLMLPIHIIGEFAKPFSLAARLFGNITGEDIVIFALVGIGLSLTGDSLNVGIPFQVLFIPLGLLFSVIQALVFTILSTIYLSLMLPQEGH